MHVVMFKEFGARDLNLRTGLILTWLVYFRWYAILTLMHELCFFFLFLYFFSSATLKVLRRSLLGCKTVLVLPVYKGINTEVESKYLEM